MSTPSDVALFVKNRIVLPDTEPPIIFVPAANKFLTVEDAGNRERISAEMWAGANIEKEKLFQKMELVRAKLIQNGQREYTIIDLHKCSWEQVMFEVKENIQSSRSLPGKCQKMRQCLDKFGDNADIFQSWLQLLPTGDYGAR
ncbi:hypothetical protein PVAG01_07376 [Phlyctema vagabunda]|uniref:Uncharacterized protein n=1 Tax=Phlyctema vagabunda TaxID=108571 RepID=A0ABR4PC77_9HELO